MHRITVFILLSLALVHTTLAAPPPRSNPPSPILPGQYRNIIPHKAENRIDPQVYISPPGDKMNKKPHPGLILEAPPGGLVKAQVITSNLRGAPGTPIQSVDRKTNLHGYLSYKQPMTFENWKVGAKYEPVKGQGPARDMSPTSLDRVKKKVLPAAAAVNAFQQGSSKGGAPRSPSPGASRSDQGGKPPRAIKPLPKRVTSPIPWKPVSAPAAKQPPSGAFAFSMPKPKSMQGNPASRVNVLAPKTKVPPAAGSKRKSTSPPPASSKRRSPSPGTAAKKPRLSRRDYLGRYYRL
ncbi:hypothetical protein BKA70DRAFT_1291299, partial [Coprinopsis sp. MPI-PUGE-AT-0042]